MKATDAIRVERQIPQPSGRAAQTTTEVVCPRCLKPVGAVQHTVNGEPFRAHNERLDDGTLCSYGQTERDPVGTIPAF